MTTLDDALNDFRGIGCSVVESIVIEAKSGSTPTPVSDFTVFRSIVYKKSYVYKVTTLGKTTLYTCDADGIYYSWVSSEQMPPLPPSYEQLVIKNATSTKVDGGWMITMVFARDGDNGACILCVTVNGLEIPLPQLRELRHIGQPLDRPRLLGNVPRLCGLPRGTHLAE